MTFWKKYGCMGVVMGLIMGILGTLLVLTPLFAIGVGLVIAGSIIVITETISPGG